MSFKVLSRIKSPMCPVALLAAVSTSLGGVGTLEAAKLLPPAEYLKKPENNLIIARAEAKADEGKVVFERRDTLHGEAPESLEVRVSEDLSRQIVMGDTYVLGVTYLRGVLREKNTFEPDPDGPRAVAIPAVGEALLADTPAMLTLVTPRKVDEELSDRDRLDAILAQVKSPHEPTRRFVLAELVLRPGMVGALDDEDLTVLQSVVETDTGLEDWSHEYLLRALMQRDDLGDQSWIAKDCRKVLGSADTELDLTSFEPALAVSAATMLGRVGNADDVSLMARQLASNNPGVARAAFESMLDLDREQALRAAKEALQDDRLHPDTRRRLETETNTIVFPGDADE